MADRKEQSLEQQQQLHKTVTQTQSVQQTQADAFCPNCGKPCAVDANFCEECGNPINRNTCPKCGQSLGPTADVCGRCGTYLSRTKCSYCGSGMEESDQFCPECGNPGAGITCPVCGVVSTFNFCTQCHTPLTEIGQKERERALKEPLFRKITQQTAELEELYKEIEAIEMDDAEEDRTLNAEKEALLSKMRAELNRHKQLLQEQNPPQRAEKTEKPVEKPKAPVIQENKTEIQSKSESKKDKIARLKIKAQEKLAQMNEMYEQMEQQTFPDPQTARTFHTARAPRDIEAVWQCNWKKYFHPGPEHCCNPVLGGKWILYEGKIEWQYGIEQI